MTRVERVLCLIERYDDLATLSVEKQKDTESGKIILKELREEAEQLKYELLTYGCRRFR
jgi:hypothetical protein